MKYPFDMTLPEMLGSYAVKGAARFHLPGHKGRGMAGFFREEIAQWDITEIEGADDLYNPSGILQKSQSLCADAFGAKRSFFLVNGSTAGVHVMMMIAAKRGSVLLSRDCHRSAISGAFLSGADCRFVMPDYDESLGRYGMPAAKEIDDMLTERPAATVMITSPNYAGMCADIPAIASVVRKHGARLFVDAAHGAHFPFSRHLPVSPAGYADMWVNSAHKTLNALGQAALLHIADADDERDVLSALQTVQTSSPSYILMASLDWARHSAKTPGLWDGHCEKMIELREKINKLPGIRVLNQTGRAGVADTDVTRITVDTSRRGITGHEAAEHLLKQNVIPEMADGQSVVFITTPSDDPLWHDMLFEALRTLPYGHKTVPSQQRLNASAERVMDIRSAMAAKTQMVPFSRAAGRIAAQSFGPYPPGIALVTPGERIDKTHIKFLEESEGRGVFGCFGGTVCCVT
ncbi:MAG: Arginine decarboxylase [Firmicutes bacterium ADurb.Bin182]|nr:MAG: Arginine decarboxylase [Firmicutes bacterium ADurb.Bin182]